MSYSRGSVLCLSPAGFHRIAYLDWGRVASDHVVLCVHGLARMDEMPKVEVHILEGKGEQGGAGACRSG